MYYRNTNKKEGGVSCPGRIGTHRLELWYHQGGSGRRDFIQSIWL